MTLYEYLLSLGRGNRKPFVTAVGTTLGHLNNIAYGFSPADPGLAIAIERESGGKVKVEETCPGPDWAYIRQSGTMEARRASKAVADEARQRARRERQRAIKERVAARAARARTPALPV